MTEYRLWKTCEDSCDHNTASSCGIALYEDGKPTRVITDLGCDCTRVAALVRLFNEEELDPVHLDQAVEDFLTDFKL